jgi:WD40 repeat protein
MCAVTVAHYTNRQLRVWHALLGVCILRIDAHDAAVTCIAVSPAATGAGTDRIVSGCADGTLRYHMHTH